MVAAYADDGALGCGGTQKNIATGVQVAVVLLNNGASSGNEYNDDKVQRSLALIKAMKL